ncbi:MAG: hypothetical protein ACK5P5_00300 [Pseudobdellovibrionaceae bacterium]
MKTHLILKCASGFLLTTSILFLASCGGGSGNSSSATSVACGGPTTVNWDTNNAVLNAQNVTPQSFPASGLRVSFSGTSQNGVSCQSMPQFVPSFQAYYNLLISQNIDVGNNCDTRVQRNSLKTQKNCAGANGRLQPNLDAAQNGFVYCQSELKSEVSLGTMFGTGFAQKANAVVIPLTDRGARNFSVGSFQVSSKIMSPSANRDEIQVEFKVKRREEMSGTFYTGLDQVGSMSMEDDETGQKLVVACQYPNANIEANDLPEELNIRCQGSLKRDREARAILFAKDLTVDATASDEMELFSNGDEEIIIRYQTLNGLRKGGIIIEASGIGIEKKREFKGGGTAASKQKLLFKEEETGYELSVECAEARRSRVADR